MRQRSEADQVVQREALAPELADGQQRSRERQGREDRVDAAAVRQPRVEHWRGLVDAPPDLARDLRDDAAQMRLVVEAHPVWYRRPARSIQTSRAPLTMISVTES